MAGNYQFGPIKELSGAKSNAKCKAITQFIKDQKGKLVKAGAKADAPVGFDVYNGVKCSMNGEVMDNDGGTVALAMATKLKFN